MEKETLESLVTDQDEGKTLILALGGGCVMTPECARLVHEKTRCIYLRASTDTLITHLEGGTEGRPLLAAEDLRCRIHELMSQRSETYEATAHIIIDTDGKDIEVNCQFCNTAYNFSTEELKKMLKRCTR